jgi:hypothetical protein
MENEKSPLFSGSSRQIFAIVVVPVVMWATRLFAQRFPLSNRKRCPHPHRRSVYPPHPVQPFFLQVVSVVTTTAITGKRARLYLWRASVEEGNYVGEAFALREKRSKAA